MREILEIEVQPGDGLYGTDWDTGERVRLQSGPWYANESISGEVPGTCLAIYAGPADCPSKRVAIDITDASDLGLRCQTWRKGSRDELLRLCLWSTGYSITAACERWRAATGNSVLCDADCVCGLIGLAAGLSPEQLKELLGCPAKSAAH